VAVHDQKHLPPPLPQQPPQETQKHRAVETLLEQQEARVAAVGNRREQIATKSLAGSGDHRRPPAAAIAAPGLMIGSQPQLVAPVNLGVFALGLPPDRRVLLFQPTLDRLGVAFVRPSQGFLRRQHPCAR
jgi:hypothetical protein